MVVSAVGVDVSKVMCGLFGKFGIGLMHAVKATTAIAITASEPSREAG